jgi:hypothetical protein
MCLTWIGRIQVITRKLFLFRGCLWRSGRACISHRRRNLLYLLLFILCNFFPPFGFLCSRMNCYIFPSFCYLIFVLRFFFLHISVIVMIAIYNIIFSCSGSSYFTSSLSCHRHLAVQFLLFQGLHFSSLTSCRRCSWLSVSTERHPQLIMYPAQYKSEICSFWLIQFCQTLGESDGYKHVSKIIIFRVCLLLRYTLRSLALCRRYITTLQISSQLHTHASKII